MVQYRRKNNLWRHGVIGMLVIFDLDSTLVEKWSAVPLPGVSEVLASMAQAGHQIAVATNQAGVSWRAKTGQEKFPRPSDIGRRLLAVAEALPPLRQALWFVAIRDPRVPLSPGYYRALAAAITRSAAPLCVRSSSNPAWRKPGPGMLLEICKTLNVLPDDVVFVGDSEDDRCAAEAAGIHFIEASSFFSSPCQFLKSRPRVRYEFSAHLCWDCVSHRAAFSSDATPEDWEILVISFLKGDLEQGASLLNFLQKLFDALGLEYEESPRKFPPSKIIAKWVGLDMVAEFAEAAGITPADTWLDGQMWWTLENSSIKNPGCPVTSLLEGKYRDIVIHAPMKVTSAILGALYDWNWRLVDEEVAIGSAVFNLMRQG